MKPLFRKNLENIEKNVVIYGINEDAVLTFAVLLQNKIYVNYFCDPENKEIGVKIMNKPVISLDKLRMQRDEIILVVGGENYFEQAEALESEGFEVFYDFNRAAYEGNSVLLMEELRCD